MVKCVTNAKENKLTVALIKYWLRNYTFGPIKPSTANKIGLDFSCSEIEIRNNENWAWKKWANPQTSFSGDKLNGANAPNCWHLFRFRMLLVKEPFYKDIGVLFKRSSNINWHFWFLLRFLLCKINWNQKATEATYLRF